MASLVKWAGGTCIVGAACEEITPGGAHAMAGYSHAGQVGRPAPEGRPESDHLWARALYLQDEESGEQTVVCFVDLMSASLRLVQEVQARLSEDDPDLARGLVLSGTHTHTAPGRFYGNRFYDLFAQKSYRGFNEGFTHFLADRIATACRKAKAVARPGTVTVHETELWGIGRNRSYAAYRENRSFPEGPVAPDDLEPEYRAVDPRITILTARADGDTVGIFSWFGCHGTTLGLEWATFHRDWFGVAVDTIERELEGTSGVVAVGAGAGGDVSAVDPIDPDRHQGLTLARIIGSEVGIAIAEAVRDILSEPSDETPLPLTLHTGLFEIEPAPGQPRWAFGVPTLGGAEDGGPAFRSWRIFSGLFVEGFRGGFGDQAPKAPALGSMQAVARGWVDVAPYHPWHRLRLGDHVICTVPGEATVVAGGTLREAARERLGATSVSVLGYAGDYGGYFTTTAEYRLQHYEGASTLYGPFTLDQYIEQMLGSERPIPRLGEPAAAAGWTMPQRDVELLTEVAYEQPPRDDRVRLVFALEGHESTFQPLSGDRARPHRAAPVLPPTPSVALVHGDRRVTGVVRPELNPDPASSLPVYVGIFRRSELENAGISLEHPETKLEVVEDPGPPGEVFGDALASWQLSIRTASQVLEERKMVSTVEPDQDFSPIQRALSILALSMLPPLALTLFAPDFLLDIAQVGATPFRALLVRMLGLSFGLLGINLIFAKNSKDVPALSGIVFGTGVFIGSLSVLTAVLGAPPLLPGLIGLGAVFAFGLGLWIQNFARRRPTPNPEAWPFWKPLFGVGTLTLVVGTFLVLGGHWAVSWLGVTDPVGHWFVRAYGISFLVNTISMWGSRYTRDLAIIKGQLWGSLFLDSITSVLLFLAVALGTVNLLGYALAIPYVGITVWFPRLLGRVRRLQRLDVLHPLSAREIQAHVDEAREQRKLIRILGSGHSVPRAIFADRAPSPPLSRPSRLPGLHLSLERMDRIVDIDRRRRCITVQAGMHLGEAPDSPTSVENNLCRHLNDLGWALPDLGGIIHQTVAGFLATGSSGGSLVHCFNDAVAEIRFIDGRGRSCVARNPQRDRPQLDRPQLHRPQIDRGDDERASIENDSHADLQDDDQTNLFNAASVSMGLLGVVTEITFRCEPAYQVRGREVGGTVVGAPTSPTEPVDEVFLELPSDTPNTPGGVTRIDLLRSGPRGLARYLRDTEYSRILWFPQAGVQKMLVWEGARTNEVARPPEPYVPDATLLQWAAGRVLTLLGLAHGNGIKRAIGRRFSWLLPIAIRQFVPERPKRFHARWDLNLPMDTHIDDYFLATEFTELWFPLRHTHEVMRRLVELYRDPEVAGTYAVELYAARKSDAWLSPAHGEDVFRVDVFWFRGNEGDPVLDYFPKFWEALSDLEYRAHWGKYLPRAGSDVARAMRARYTHLPAFLAKRQEHDPGEVFLSRYWRRHLDWVEQENIERSASPVPQSDADETRTSHFGDTPNVAVVASSQQAATATTTMPSPAPPPRPSLPEAEVEGGQVRISGVTKPRSD